MEPLNCDELGTRSVNQQLRSSLEEPRPNLPVGPAQPGRRSVVPAPSPVEGNAGYFLGGSGGSRTEPDPTLCQGIRRLVGRQRI